MATKEPDENEPQEPAKTPKSHKVVNSPPPTENPQKTKAIEKRISEIEDKQGFLEKQISGIMEFLEDGKKPETPGKPAKPGEAKSGNWLEKTLDEFLG